MFHFLPWAMITILLANVIIAFPILANGHAGAKYGIPSTISTGPRRERAG